MDVQLDASVVSAASDASAASMASVLPVDADQSYRVMLQWAHQEEKNWQLESKHTEALGAFDTGVGYEDRESPISWLVALS